MEKDKTRRITNFANVLLDALEMVAQKNATVKKGVPSSITNYCYEHKKSNYTYVLAKVGFKSSSSVTGSVEGVWSPDSTKNYTIVN